MKTLFLVRHAKSSRDDPMLPDKNRPLNERGMRDASRVGDQLAKRDANPDLIVSSPAQRALTTAEIVARKLGYRRKDIAVEDRLYAATPDELLAVIREVDDKVKRVMLFGHNPEVTELAHRLSRKITDMVTCAVAEFAFDSESWSDVGAQEPRSTILRSPEWERGQPVVCTLRARTWMTAPRRTRTDRRRSEIDPHLTLAFLDGGRSTARSNDAKRSRHTQRLPRLAGQ